MAVLSQAVHTSTHALYTKTTKITKTTKRFVISVNVLIFVPSRRPGLDSEPVVGAR